MKATVYFLVEVLEDYNNHVTLSNGLRLAVNNSIDNVEHINRIGKLISGPQSSNAKPGDMLMFHHNICRRSWGLKSKKRRSSFYVKDSFYYIPASEIFMIKREGLGAWEALDPYVFLRPLQAERRVLNNGLEIMEDSYKDRKNLMGTISHSNKTLRAAGVQEGDLVAFQQDSEFEFKIGEEIFYRMKTADILAVYEGP